MTEMSVGSDAGAAPESRGSAGGCSSIVIRVPLDPSAVARRVQDVVGKSMGGRLGFAEGGIRLVVLLGPARSMNGDFVAPGRTHGDGEHEGEHPRLISKTWHWLLQADRSGLGFASRRKIHIAWKG